MPEYAFIKIEVIKISLKKNNLIGILIILIINVSFVSGESINKSTNQSLNESNNNTNYNNYELKILEDDPDNKDYTEYDKDYTELFYGEDEYEIFQGDDIVVSSILEDTSNLTPIVGENVSCIITNSSGDISHVIFNKSAVTNDDGIASVNLTNLNLSVGDYIIHWYYAGSDQYFSVYPKEYSTLKIKQTLPTPSPSSNGTDNSNNGNNSLLNGDHLPNTGFPLILLLILIIVSGFSWKRK